MRLIGRVVAGKPLIPGPPLCHEPGALRLREMLEVQRVALLTHDPGVRVGEDPENLHRHRVAARRTRAFLRTARKHLDPGWRRPLNEALKQLGEATGPVRDLDVALAHLRPELEGLDETDQHAKALLLERLEEELERHPLELRRRLGHQGLSHLRRACKRDLADLRVPDKDLREWAGVLADHYIHDACRQARLVQDLRQRQSRQRGG